MGQLAEMEEELSPCSLPGTVSKQKSPSPHNVCLPLSAPLRRWVSHPRCIGGRPRQTGTSAFEAEMLERIGNNPSTSRRAIVHAMGSNQSSVLWVLQEQTHHVYHLQEIQGLGPNDFKPRVRFVQWFLQRSIVNPAFAAQVLFTDEASFTRDGYFNSRNSHI